MIVMSFGRYEIPKTSIITFVIRWLIDLWGLSIVSTEFSGFTDMTGYGNSEV